MKTLGLSEIELRGDFGSDTFNRFGAENLDAFSASSPRDLTALVSMIARGEVISREACDQMLDIMSRCQHIEYLGRYLPVDPFAVESGSKPRVALSNKLGAYLHGRCDVGLVDTAEARYVVTVMTAGGAVVTHKSWSRNGHRMVTNCQGLADTGCDNLIPSTPMAWY